MRSIAIILASIVLASCRLFDRESPAPTLRVLWSTSVSTAAHGTPGLIGDGVIASFEDQKLRAFRVTDGALIWSSTAAGRNLYPREVYISADSMAIVTAATEVIGYSTGDGQLKWRFAMPADSSLNVIEGGVMLSRMSLDASRKRIAVAAWGSKVSVVQTVDAAKVWTWNAGVPNKYRHGANGTLWCGNTIYVSLWRYLDDVGASSRHSIAALDAADGREQWRVDLPYQPFAVAANGEMACDDHNLFATTVGGPLWAVDRHTGAVAWQAARPRGYLNQAGPLLINDVVLADDGSRETICRAKIQ